MRSAKAAARGSTAAKEVQTAPATHNDIVDEKGKQNFKERRQAQMARQDGGLALRHPSLGKPVLQQLSVLKELQLGEEAASLEAELRGMLEAAHTTSYSM